MTGERDDSPDVRDLLEAVTDYLRWQKKLGHPGIPVERILARKQARREAAPPPEEAPRPARAPRPAAPPRPEPAGPPVFKPAPAPATPAPPSAVPLPEPMGDPGRLDAIRASMGECARCKLAATRSHIVFGEGNPQADILFIGEGPGADEDAQARPFVGRAGQLLTRWIELGMGIPRSQVYIANIVKCRPPNNRDPEGDEAEACMPFLLQQIRAISPKAIVLLGRVPMGRLLGVKDGITKVHGTWYEFEGIPTMPIFHPSYCLRPPQDEKRRIVWEDLKKLLTRLDMPIPSRK